MSNKSKQIIDALVVEDLYTAKKLVNASLFERMNTVLEEKLIDFAPTIFNEGKTLSPKQKKIAKMGGDPKKIDAEDFAKLRKLRESEELFIQELSSLVEEIEAETGETLTEEEVADLANDLLDVMDDNLSDDSDDDYQDSDDDYQDSDDDYIYDETK